MNALPLLPGVIQAFNAAVAVIRRVRVTVHTGYLPPSPEKFVFVNVVNKSPRREIEIVAVWFEGKRQIPALEPTRPLPKRLRPDQLWETWVGYDVVKEIPARHLYNAARVRLSTGNVIYSIRNRTVPPAGTPAGP